MASFDEDSQLVWVKSWDAKVPPPSNSLKGKIVPRMFLKANRRRKIAVEVHRIYHDPSGSAGSNSEHQDSSAKAFYDQCVIRILVPVGRASRSSRNVHDNKQSDDESDHDDTTSMPQEFMDDGSMHLVDIEQDRDWKAKYRFPIKAVSITNLHKNTVSVYIVLGTLRQHRELVFATNDDANDFAQAVQAQLDKEPERVAQKLEVTAKGVPFNDEESVTLLVEICSARKLLAGDFYSSDPYVQVLFEGKEIHRTDYVRKSLDPIWTVKTNSLFLWTVNTRELFISEGILCVVFDYDHIGSHEHLGQVYVSPKLLYEASEERIELPLKPPHTSIAEGAGYLAVRCRRATEYDQHFMLQLAETRIKEKREEAMPDFQKIRDITKLATESNGGSGNIASILTRRSKVVKSEEHPEGLKMYKVRPGADPNQPKDTTWLTEQQLHDESIKQSNEWIDSGSGRLGCLFVEVIACDGLPNLDAGGIIGNKTDAFVSVVFEDSFVTTDVVDDCLSPRWMPWTKRAFMFRIMHSSSQLFLGVFDYDVSFNPADWHDFIGRVSIDLSNLRKDTTYTMTYNLYTSARMSHRKRRGTITLRLRLDIDDDRQFLLSSLYPPPQIQVNVKTLKHYQVVRCTCTGKTDMSKYSMQIINSYIEELLILQQVGFYVQDAATSLLLWRSTTLIKCNGHTISLPVHSMVAFVLSALVVERPQFFPSFVLFGIAWLLLATMEYRQHLPDVWSRCKSFRELAECLIYGESRARPDAIDPFMNSEATEAFLKQWQQRITIAEDIASKAYADEVVEPDDELEPLLTADVLPSKKRGGSGISLDPFRPILFPIQQNLAFVCRTVRHVKYILFWEECYISFWIVSACLLLAAAFLFVPWFYFIQWSSRIFVWSLLGPWMKLVDMLYVQGEKVDVMLWLRGNVKQSQGTAALNKARIQQEDQKKLRAMKEYQFGRYVTRVPVLKEDRYRDMPLPQSFAEPYRPATVPLSELAMQEAGYRRKRLQGQDIRGNMIPQPESHGRTDAPIGRATAKPRLVNKHDPGGKLTIGSTMLDAYVQIGFLLVAAGLVTWVGVPVVSYLVAQ